MTAALVCIPWPPTQYKPISFLQAFSRLVISSCYYYKTALIVVMQMFKNLVSRDFLRIHCLEVTAREDRTLNRTGFLTLRDSGCSCREEVERGRGMIEV